ncbi:type VI secretion system protein TssL, long form [Neisseria sp. Ec49-e6-T10]|uniref:type VI secretion system protein TssL, long form n=1 Tax=Neisseria sp. Ec49-e6-T10 TaxID=3140744 RepID=UPI003EBC807E
MQDAIHSDHVNVSKHVNEYIENPLLEAVNPLLDLILIMKDTISLASLDTLLEQLSDEIRQFETKAESLGVNHEAVKNAEYCICTVADEFAARAGWADESWAARSLLVTFHNETWGGEKFFQLLDKLKQDPKRNIDLLELMYFCLSFGYMGKFQVLPNGTFEIERIKRDLNQIILEQRGPSDNVLSTHWRGVYSPLKAGRKVIPFWVLAVFAILIIGFTYYVCVWNLGRFFDTTSTTVASLTIPEIKKPKLNNIIRLEPLLKREIDQKLITVKDEADRSTVTILGDGLFESASAQVKDKYFPVLATVSQALNSVKGNILVRGYTDDQPIKSSSFPSNWHLSQARSDAVKDILLNYIQNPNRVRSEGRGATDALAPNNSAQNRALNRRVEIIVFVSGLDVGRLGTTASQTDVQDKTDQMPAKKD